MSSAQGDHPDIWKNLASLFFQVPSLGIALGLTLGFVLDSSISPPAVALLVFFAASGIAWVLNLKSGKPRLGYLYLGMMLVALGAILHFQSARMVLRNDVRLFLTDKQTLLRFRGIISKEPKIWASNSDQDLRSFPSKPNSSLILKLGMISTETGWQEVHGSIRILVNETITDLHTGDEVEVFGKAKLIDGPENPGEWDYRGFLAQQGIFGELRVRGSGTLLLLRPNPAPSLHTLLTRTHDWAAAIIENNLPENLASLAEALLLGDSPGMGSNEWDKYRNTGVLHVLAISGQHLAILGFCFSWFLRTLRFRSQTIALLIPMFLLGYALLTGGRPSAMRAAIMVGAFSLGWILRRPAPAIHAISVAWIILLILQPWDIFSPGSILSFLATACLIWVVPKFQTEPLSPLDQLTYETRPLWQKLLLDLWGGVWEGYKISAVIWVLVTPLAVYYTHVVSPIGLLIGPILIFLTTIALIAGFTSLLLGSLIPFFATMGGWLMYPLLAGCSVVVELADKTPGAYFYLADKSLWFIVAGYLLFAIWLAKPLIVSKKIWLVSAGAWAVAFLIPWRWAPRDLQITFLSVGHGSCVVLETPGKEVIVYDAGSISGPEITRRKIAPFLWNKGIQRVDYLFLSHADLDHFNAVPSLQKMFPIGQIIVNPGFFQKITPGVKQIQKLKQAHGIFREAPRGTSFEFTSLKGEVLHPPSSDFPGNENSRSLVLEWMYKGHRIMLTGDLAGPGLSEITRSSIGPVDLLMAPHHGSASSLIEPFLQWANPDILVASQSANDPQPPVGIEDNYKWFSTAKEGAILFEFHKNGVAVESFISQSRKIIPGRKFRE